MALNPAAAHINFAAHPPGKGEVAVRRNGVGPAFVAQARQEPVIDPGRDSQFDGLNPDYRRTRIADVSRRNTEDKLGQGGDLRSFGGGFYGDYWDAPLPVFSMAAFEAQLFMQDREGADQPGTSHGEGIHFYQDIKSVLERALAAPTDADDVIERDSDKQRVNLLA